MNDEKIGFYNDENISRCFKQIEKSGIYSEFLPIHSSPKISVRKKRKLFKKSLEDFLSGKMQRDLEEAYSKPPGINFEQKNN